MKRALPLLLLALAAGGLLLVLDRMTGTPGGGPGGSGGHGEVAAAGPTGDGLQGGGVRLEGSSAAGPDAASGDGREREALTSETTGEPEDGPCHVLGRVLDPDGRAVEGARVRLEPQHGLALRIGGPEPIPEDAPTTHTDAEGRFRLASDERGARLLAVDAATFLRGERTVQLVPGCDYPVGDLVLTRAALVAGEVVRQDGAPVADASIELLPPVASGVFQLGPRTGREVARSDAAGRFACSTVPPGSFELRVRHPEHPDLEVHGRTSHQEPADRLRIELPVGFALEGTVAGSDPVEDLVVRAWHVSDTNPGFLVDLGQGDGPGLEHLVREGEVGADRTFRISGLPVDRDLKLAVFRRTDDGNPYVAPAGPVVETSAPASGLTLEQHRPFRVSARLIGGPEGAAVELAHVELRGANRGWITTNAYDPSADPEPLPGGRVLLESLRVPPGQEGLSLRVRAPGHETWESQPFAAPSEGDVDLGEVTLTPGPGVRVEVRDGATGRPLAQARVEVHELRPEEDGGGEVYLGSRTTDAEGRVLLVVPVERRVRLTARHDGFARADRELEVVRPTALVTFDLERPGRVDVRALDGQDTPMADVRVEHRSPHGEHAARTDAAGHVRFAGLEPGTHAFRVGKAEADGMVFWGVEDDSAPEESWVEVEVLAGGRHELVVRQEALATLEGVVLLDGAPLVGARVRFRKSTQGSHFFIGGGDNTTPTDDAGRFRLEGLAPESGRLVVEHERLLMKQVEPLRLRPGRQRVDLSFALTVVEGRVLDTEGRPVVGAQVVPHLVQDDLQEVQIFWGTTAAPASADVGDPRPDHTDAFGQYRLEGVRPGMPMRLAVEGEHLLAKTQDVPALDPGELRRDVDFEVLRGGGLVVRHGDTDGHLVRLTFEGTLPEGQSEGTQTHHMANGELRVGVLRSGPWRVALLPLADSDADQEPLTETTVEVVAGEERTVDV